MIPVLSREQMRAFDADASGRGQVSSLVLMENAGRGAALLLEHLCGQAGRRSHSDGSRSTLVICGTGNNGGDGLVLARHALILGRSVKVLVVGDEQKFTAPARIEFEALRASGTEVSLCVPESARAVLGGDLGSAEVVVDALFGIGLDRQLSPDFVAILALLNQASALRIALDIPSGLDADTGRVLGGAFRAHHTLTFVAPKLGLLTTTGSLHAGQIHVVPIGVPGPLPESGSVQARWLECSDISRWLGPRSITAHKGSVGRVAIVAGSPGKIGAAFLSARGALRAGAALVTLMGLPKTTQIFAQRVTEEMTATLNPRDPEGSLREALTGMDVVVVGPGLGLGTTEKTLVRTILAEFPGNIVVDADALTHFSGRADELRAARGKLVLTPHPGEMARLLGTDVATIESDRFSAVARAVELTGHVVLLKGPRTIIGAPGHVPYINSSGSPVLATGGSGDVLSGVLGGLLLSLPPFEAAACAAFLHGQSGQLWSEATGADRGMLAREIADGIPKALASLSA